MAVMIKLYQLAYGSVFDHCGVIIVNPNTGVPHILQTTPFGNYSLQSFEQEIMRSSAHEVVIIHLENTEEAESAVATGDPGTKPTSDKVPRTDVDYGSLPGATTMEFFGLISGVFNHFASISGGYRCPSSALILGVYENILGLKLKDACVSEETNEGSNSLESSELPAPNEVPVTKRTAGRRKKKPDNILDPSLVTCSTLYDRRVSFVDKTDQSTKVLSQQNILIRTF